MPDEAKVTSFRLTLNSVEFGCCGRKKKGISGQFVDAYFFFFIAMGTFKEKDYQKQKDAQHAGSWKRKMRQ